METITKSLKFSIVFFIFLLFATISFSNENAKISGAVMDEGMIIILHSQHGELIIIAQKGCKRTFIWDHEKFETELIPRKSEWYGKLGLYHPQLRPPHKGVVHMVVEEYEFNYSSVEASIKDMNKYHGIEDIYNDDGLFVRFDKQINNSDQVVINIQIVQILINGEKPTQIPGSQNERLEIKRALNL